MSTAMAVDPVISVEALTEMIRAECADVDRSRRLPDSVVDALRDSEVFRLLATRDVGGAELDPPTFLRLVEAAAHADGSVGWCVMIGGCYATFAGLLPARGPEEIFGDRKTIAAGAFRPSGVAERVDGGYRVSGRWQLASGSTHANWYIAGCAVTSGGQPQIAASGMPVMREVFLPAASVEVVDTWDSIGLRGTASNDYAVADVFVPEHRTMWFQELPRCDRPLYRMPPIATFATYIGAVSLGIARHAVDAFAELATAKTPTMSTDVLADNAAAQAVVGHAHAVVSAGRLPPARRAQRALGAGRCRPRADVRRPRRAVARRDARHADMPRRRRPAVHRRRCQFRLRQLRDRPLPARRPYRRPARVRATVQL